MGYFDDRFQSLLSDVSDIFGEDVAFRKIIIQVPDITPNSLPFCFDRLIEILRTASEKLFINVLDISEEISWMISGRTLIIKNSSFIAFLNYNFQKFCNNLKERI